MFGGVHHFGSNPMISDRVDPGMGHAVRKARQLGADKTQREQPNPEMAFDRSNGCGLRAAWR